jgi:hypothetical protein
LGRSGRLAVSFESGLEWDANTSRRCVPGMPWCVCLIVCFLSLYARTRSASAQLVAGCPTLPCLSDCIGCRKLESLRKALRFEVVPVVSSFDPKFNNGKPLWFEQLYEPFKLQPQQLL